jgi:hypothetical protein
VKRSYIGITLIVVVVAGALAFYSYSVLTSQASRRERAVGYLENSYNSTLGLCFEYLESDTYWLSHDNILVYYALRGERNSTIAYRILGTVQRIANEYNLTAGDNLPVDCKLKALLGYNVYGFNHTGEITLNSSYYGSVLKSERDLDSNFSDFDQYADMLCYASFVEWWRANQTKADYYYEKVKTLWDGNGFKDKAFNITVGYETYKLGLFYLLSTKLGEDFAFKNELIETIWSCQDANGGFKTHYFNKGNPNPNSKTNAETTAIILLSQVFYDSEL